MKTILQHEFRIDCSVRERTFSLVGLTMAAVTVRAPVLMIGNVMVGRPHMHNGNLPIFEPEGLHPIRLLVIMVFLLYTKATGAWATEQGASEVFWTGSNRLSIENVLLWSEGGPYFCGGPLVQATPSGGNQAQEIKKRREPQIKRLGQKYLPGGNLTILKRAAIRGNRTMRIKIHRWRA